MHLFWIPVISIMSVLKGSTGQSVAQTEGSLTVAQGGRIFLNCTYAVKAGYQAYPFWYIQHPGQPLKLFLRDLGKDASDEGALRGFQAEHDKAQKSFHLEKAASQLSDSVVYFCAVSDTVRLARREVDQKPQRRREQRGAAMFRRTLQ